MQPREPPPGRADVREVSSQEDLAVGLQGQSPHLRARRRHRAGVERLVEAAVRVQADDVILRDAAHRHEPAGDQDATVGLHDDPVHAPPGQRSEVRVDDASEAHPAEVLAELIAQLGEGAPDHDAVVGLEGERVDGSKRSEVAVEVLPRLSPPIRTARPGSSGRRRTSRR
ncbi:MAG TPA: hypothetical protein VMT85_17725 [Thermoanaerobaculia bacterium]|nr:hypothetical protein [Thermoanaerobaculia bacterium]